jgi:hypothetical protein
MQADAYRRALEGRYAMNSDTASDSVDLERRPARLVVATIVLGLTGLAFLAAAAVLIYAMQVNAPPVALLFGVIAAVLLAIAVLHFVAVRGIWLRVWWAALLGIVISLVGTAIPAYIAFDQLTHSDDPRYGAPYLVTAVLYAVCLLSLLSIGKAFRHVEPGRFA